MRVVIVNEKDEVIGYKERSKVTKENIYRVSALWLTNYDGKVLLAKRAKTKSHDPGKWGPAAAGTIEEDESYEENIAHEAAEEIGLTGYEFTKGPKYLNKDNHNHFTQWFFLKIKEDYNFVLNDEVEEVKWWDLEELSNTLEDNASEFLVKMPEYVNQFSKSL